MKYYYEALNAWESVVGPSAVLRDLSGSVFGHQATFASNHAALAVVSPSSREEVQDCLRVANTYRVPVYPVSAGKNWGFGSSVPAQAGCVLLDLRRMNRITDFSEELAFVSVEPGVTFGQIAGYLRERESRLMLSVPGTTPDASVLANALERGHGSGVYADRFQHVCGLEVVLPTGDFVCTGYRRFPGARAAKVARWGIGPFFDGLFSQSNFGVVTGMTVWLSPKPVCFELCEFGVESDERLGAVVDALRRLRLGGIVRYPVTLWNDIKVLSLYQRYPWELAGFRTPLPAAVHRLVTESRKILPWTGWIALCSPNPSQAQADREAVVRSIQPLVDTWVVRGDNGVFNPSGAGTHFGNPQYGPSFGVPSEASIRCIYWRKKSDSPERVDLDRDGCGKLTLSISAPFEGAHIQSAIATMGDIITAHGYEPFISVIGVSERHAEVIAFIVYDRDIDGEDDRAMLCYKDLNKRINENGFISDRIGIQGMDSLPESAGDYARFSRAIKRAVDPNGILAPGRYDCPVRPFDAADDTLPELDPPETDT